MKDKLYKVLIVIFAAGILFSGGMLIHEWSQYKAGEQSYDQADALAGLNEASATSATGTDPYAESLRQMNFTALREVNPEVLGWIVIPDTQVSYPLMHHSDDDYYLRRTWDFQNRIVGSIFMEAQNNSTLEDFNTLIYGHSMKNGSMFGSLKEYKDPAYLAAHPNIYITTDSGARRYEIFAVYETTPGSDTYQIGFASAEDQAAYLASCLEQSVHDVGIKPDSDDRIITLSTCTGSGNTARWVVQGVLRETLPKP